MYQFLAKSKILVIDDFAGFRQTIKTMLVSLGAQQIDQAGNGSEAIKRCTEFKYNIIFCDYNLGDGQDGQQILEELHHRSLMRRGTLFLMVTAETTTAQVMGAIEYRPDAYLTKPFTSEQLGQRLKRLVTKNVALEKIYQAINLQQIDKAIKLCDEVIVELPRVKFSALRVKSELLEKQEDYSKTMDLFKEVIAQQPVLWAMVGVGRLLFIRGETQAALEHFQGMLNDFPRQVSLFDWIAKCQNALGYTEKSQQTLLDAIQISPKSVTRQSALGAVASANNNHDLAQKCYARTIQEGTYSCLLKPRHFERYYATTREVIKTSSGREKSKLLAEAESINKKMERAYVNDPTARAANLSAAALLYASVDQTDKSTGMLSKLSKTLENPNCRISSDQLTTIQQNLQDLVTDKSSQNYLDKITTHLNVLKQKNQKQPIASTEIEDKTVSSKKLNIEGMQLAKQGKLNESLDKFREAIQVFPENSNAILNLSQLILEHKVLYQDPDKLVHAKSYLQKLNIDENDIRWKRYQNLVAKVSNV